MIGQKNEDAMPGILAGQDPDIILMGNICDARTAGIAIDAALSGHMVLAGMNATRLLQNQPLLTLPADTMLGALCHYICHAEPKNFQPMKANFGILPPFEKRIRNKRARYEAYADRAKQSLEKYLARPELIGTPTSI